ncbi:uncharacterized protein NDAI_0G05270 [Naumovozyma dairenensis CBS 421]|uniref:Uncharacterized protein n=1 Tax=Naumovozyma dairenensis (strain ATCC 10597 / BCRC 20456 / CBS 421 / NBRC 0211 / NRRL Y-12639) TaxID=1071378 RepID=J7SBR8_NAUDC|nr:hypothetical protein NDAI_0G05270 [Naumovozyma dairenensis CBS 421]CCK73510.1 hypothetical protein NDAI_0G05270 [Naumovozyma dairenensis CBS 421]
MAFSRSPVKTPTLVGSSVRDIDDVDTKEEPFVKVHDRSRSLNRISQRSRSPRVDDEYTTVDELNREGALLTEETDIDLDKSMPIKDLTEDCTKYTLNKKLNRNDNKNLFHHPKGNVEDKNILRNSYGQAIKFGSDRPHLAHGESYQSVGDGTENDAEVNERLGRTNDKPSLSKDYLRSLSKSLTREKNRDRSPNGRGMTTFDDKIYSTNNYTISQVDIGNVSSNIIAEEEQEDREGVLLDDQGNEEYSRKFETEAENVMEAINGTVG